MVTDAVHDVAFAPNLGRSYHLLGIATKTLKIITIEPLRLEFAVILYMIVIINSSGQTP